MSRPQDDETMRGVIVLGMHRSGTSLLANLLGELGLDYGGPRVAPREDNPRGFFEHQGVVDVHNQFLTDLGRRWDDPRPFQEQDFTGDAAGRARRELAAVHVESFAPHPQWVLKDPRHCRLLPLWDEVLVQAPEVVFVVLVRGPWAVAASLEERDGMRLEQALLLWLRHHLESERATRGRRRVFLGFETLAADPVATLERLCEQLGIPRDAARCREVCDRVLDPGQIHHQGESPAPEATEPFPWVQRTVAALSAVTAGTGATALDELDGVAAEIATADRLLGPGLIAPVEAVLDELALDRRNLVEQLEESQTYAASLKEQLEESQTYAASLKETLPVKEEELGSLRSTLVAKDEHIVHLQEALAGKDEEILKLYQALDAGDGERETPAPEQDLSSSPAEGPP